MSLASVIRLEFAYPGVGVLAGDSIQYLSIATAHGVIMVFFMIMPAIFGAFGNFLLPTQLGVHDVAFPRLNSAAFWFLPGGLIMLCQLVCVDRRYQRMNCFNIRELQGILKRKFFPDLININDHKFLDSSIIGLRYKQNSSDSVRPDQSLFYNIGITNIPKQKSHTLLDYSSQMHYKNNFFLGDKPFSVLIEFFNNINPTHLTSYFVILLREIFLSCNFYLSYSITTIFDSTRLFNETVLNNAPFVSSTLNTSFMYFFLQSTPVRDLNIPSYKKFIFKTDNLNYPFNTTNSYNQTSSFSETSNSFRFTKFYNPLISYDYKCGHYLMIWDQLYPGLSTSFIEVARGIRKSPWFYSDQFIDITKNNFNKFFSRFTTQLNLKLADVDNWYSAHITSSDSFINIFYLLNRHEGFLNLR
jgi:hypothetical protein